MRRMPDDGFRLFYRIVRSSRPALRQFQSAQELGVAEPASPTRRAVWDGLSVMSTLNQARRKQRISSGIGSYIAIIRVPTDGSIRFRRTLSEAGHHTIWADAAILLSLVVSVEPAGRVD
jgi:hypothetical protein